MHAVQLHHQLQQGTDTSMCARGETLHEDREQKEQGAPLAASVARRELAEAKTMRPLAPICRSASSRSFTFDLRCESHQVPPQALRLADSGRLAPMRGMHA